MTKVTKFAARSRPVWLLLAGMALLLTLLLTVCVKVGPGNILGGCIYVTLLTRQKPSPMPPPDQVFRQQVLNPIPESVTNIRADRPQKYGGYRYTLKFNISKADLSSLIASRDLQRVWNPKYENGSIGWAWNTWNGYGLDGHNMTVYHTRDLPGPEWFKPDLWDDPEAYARKEDIGDKHRTHVLLYDEQVGEAYFVASEWE